MTTRKMLLVGLASGLLVTGCDLLGVLPTHSDGQQGEDEVVLSSHPPDPNEEDHPTETSNDDDIVEEQDSEDAVDELDEPTTTDTGVTEEETELGIAEVADENTTLTESDGGGSGGGGSGGGSSGGGSSGGGPTFVGPPEPPEPSSLLQVTAIQDSSRRMSISWTQGSVNYANYYIQRFASNGDWTQLHVADGEAREYLDDTAVDELSACYRVIGYSNSSAYEYSDEVCVANPTLWEPAETPLTLVVTNEDELRNAGYLSAFQDVEILVDGLISLETATSFSHDEHTVRMRGISSGAGIVFTKTWDGDWNSSESVSTNGLTFKGSHTIIENLSFSGYEGRGSALKFHVTETVLVRNCKFSDISTIVRQPKNGYPIANASEVWFASPVGGGYDSTDMWIDSCTFQRCAINSLYAHAIYVWGRTVSVTNSTFTACGTSLQFTGDTLGGGMYVLRNAILDQPKIPNREGTLSNEWLMYYMDLESVYAFNRVTGSNYSLAHYGSTSRETQRINYNDYSGMAMPTHWAHMSPEYYTFDEWASDLQHDLDSRPPQ